MALAISIIFDMQRYYSNIYWHFTGSPKDIDWREVKCPADITNQGPILDANEALHVLTLILGSNKLLGTCTERVVENLETEKFCCVTDIPLKDLPTHSPYYGKVAIGFKATAIHKKFLPVLYVPTASMPFIEQHLPNRKLASMAFDFFKASGSFQEQQGAKLLALASHTPEIIRKPDVDAIQGFWFNFLKVTNFDAKPENSFYREREWRNIGDFQFEKNDVSAVVAPEDLIGTVRDFLDENGYPKSISILAWELIEGA